MSAFAKTEPEVVRVVIIDDHQLLIDGLVRLLAREQSYRVVGTFTDPITALEAIPALKADLALVDLDMPRMGGPELIRNLKSRCDNMHALVLTMHADLDTARTVIASGAQGYLLKTDDEKDLLIGLSAVSLGKRHFSPRISELLAGAIVSTEEKEIAISRHLITAREREVLSLIVDGLTNREIADQLCVASSTVETHRKALMRKLDVNNVAGLVRVALRQNLV